MGECHKKDFDCSLGFAMAVIGSKWRAVILWHIMKASPIRYGTLKSQIRGISHKVFTEELKQLEADGLIERSAYATVPPKVEYAVTTLGRTLEPILAELCQWGKTYMMSNEKENNMAAVTTLGLGKTMEMKLHSVGIHSAEELMELGSKQAVFRLKEQYPTTCVVILYHLEAAIRGIEIKQLDDTCRAELKAFFKQL